MVVSCIALDQPTDVVAGLSELLSADERERAARFHRDDVRRRFVVSHGALRRIAGAHVGLDAAALRFDGAAGTKPRLANAPPGRGLSFSLSHSGEIALVALTDAAPVGVDVEHVRPLDDPWRLAERVFTAAEIRALRAQPAERLLEAWFECWTRKEAVLKAIGTGLGIDPRSVELLAPAFAPAACAGASGDSGEFERAAGGAAWVVSTLAAAPGYVGALAVMSRTARTHLVRWPR